MKIRNVHLLLTKSLKLRLIQLRGATLATLLSYIEDRLNNYVVYFNFELYFFMLAT